ncbi:MAG TPA: ABC transporter permease [Puia sp.]|jgi:ABC-type antimicrobial peptide transport system permease subunit
MLQTKFKFLLRSLWRNKSFSLLNISGLAVGIAASLLIFLLIRYELSVDTWHSKRDRIYRVISVEAYRNGTTSYDGCAPTPLADDLRREFPQAEQVAHVWRAGKWPFILPDTRENYERLVAADNIYFADTALFKIFDIPWLAGNPGVALKEPFTMAISRSVADSWFGHWQDAIGKTVLQGEDRTPFRITGVMEDPRPNTDVPMNVVLSYATYRTWNEKELADPRNYDNFSTSSQCFFLLRKGLPISSMEALLPKFVATHFTPLYAQSDSRDSCYFQPLKEMHFARNLERYGKPGWSYGELWAMGLIGGFLLLVACINFINLATAQSLIRAKEIGVKKVLGSNRSQLLTDFLRETGLIVLLAMGLGYLLAMLSLPALRTLLEKPVHLDASWPTILFLSVIGILVTFLAGFYPGLVLSRFNPIAAFKGKINARIAGGITFRRGLLVLQFTIAQLLIIATLVIVGQMDYFHSRPMGFERKAIALVSLPWSRQRVPKNQYFKQQALNIRGVVSASLCDVAPSNESNNSSLFVFDHHSQPEGFELVHRAGDSAYLSLFRIGLVAGRLPFRSDTGRQEKCLLNETVVRMLGETPAGVLNKHIQLGMHSDPVVITGVVRDFNNGSLREKVEPLAIFSSANRFGTLAVKLDPSNMKQTLTQLKTAFTKTYPGDFFTSRFFDDSVADFYRAEGIASTLFKIFAALAIFISCLGLYGLVSFMAVQKTREVGLRKVLGASVTDIILLFSKEFTILITLAFLIAAPLGYFFMHRWLTDFYYHIQIGWEVFAIAIFASVTIAWITVGYKAAKAAVANPVKSLRTE